MLAYKIEDMTCGHCASTITRAVRDVDAGAKLEVDIGAHLVRIEPASADAAEFTRAITEAGYTPVQVTEAPAPLPGAAGCGCGS
ncbi:MAG TPA: heavy-metal-associated domain-containing protein [Burkholderiaceae bacterium]|nr:heavy-metal-associated domain-containing protein [Burkholderiaceae bacterium]